MSIAEFALCVISVPSLGLAQSLAPPTTSAPAQALAYDIVTIKPHGQGSGWNLADTPDGYSGQNVSLLKLVQEAYGDDHFARDPKLVTGGPSWIDKDKFDLEAKFDPTEVSNAKNLSYRQKADMLRAVLADRFQLKIHFETKEFPVYDLVIAKDGPKFTETKPGDVVVFKGVQICERHSDVNFNFSGVGCRLRDLEPVFRYASGRTVIDHTGLTGRYDIKLRFAPLNTPENSPIADRPLIFTALPEQLGLKLEPATAPLDVLVIDSAEKPSDN
jgi:uncharacterized protein (TIGR03435 family)